MRIKFMILATTLFPLVTSLAAAQVTISPSGDSKPVLSSGGKKVWPPVGDGCEALIRCCDAAEKLESTASLMCQMTVATPPVDCVKALQTFKTYLGERKVHAPAECAK